MPPPSPPRLFPLADRPFRAIPEHALMPIPRERWNWKTGRNARSQKRRRRVYGQPRDGGESRVSQKTEEGLGSAKRRRRLCGQPITPTNHCKSKCNILVELNILVYWTALLFSSFLFSSSCYSCSSTFIQSSSSSSSFFHAFSVRFLLLLLLLTPSLFSSTSTHSFSVSLLLSFLLFLFFLL